MHCPIKFSFLRLIVVPFGEQKGGQLSLARWRHGHLLMSISVATRFPQLPAFPIVYQKTWQADEGGMHSSGPSRYGPLKLESHFD